MRIIKSIILTIGLLSCVNAFAATCPALNANGGALQIPEGWHPVLTFASPQSNIKFEKAAYIKNLGIMYHSVFCYYEADDGMILLQSNGQFDKPQSPHWDSDHQFHFELVCSASREACEF